MEEGWKGREGKYIKEIGGKEKKKKKIKSCTSTPKELRMPVREKPA